MPEHGREKTCDRLDAVGPGLMHLAQQERQRGELAVMEVEGLREERSVWLVRRSAIQSHAAKAFVAVAVSFVTHGPLGERCMPLKEEAQDISGRSKMLLVKQRA